MKHSYRILGKDTDVSGKRVLIRLDLNVPIQKGRVVDDFRITRVMPTLELLRSKGARGVIIGHIEGEVKTLQQVFDHMNERFPLKAFIRDYVSECVPEAIENLKPGEFVMCENLRHHDGEKDNAESFARALAKIADIYVNEAFSVSHRNHASIVGVPALLPSFAGSLFANEVESLSQAFSPLRPALFVLGGAKFETKFPLLEKFLNFYDYVFVGGALSNDIFKTRGLEVGQSRVSESSIDLTHLSSMKNLYVPVDVTVQNRRGIEFKKPDQVSSDDSILDVGPETGELLKDLIRRSRFILWNGPLGNYEMGFKGSSEDLARYVASGTIRSVIGGGDTLAVVSELSLVDQFDFVSTAGGAMLDFLAHETLPGIKALENAPRS